MESRQKQYNALILILRDKHKDCKITHTEVLRFWSIDSWRSALLIHEWFTVWSLD